MSSSTSWMSCKWIGQQMFIFFVHLELFTIRNHILHIGSYFSIIVILFIFAAKFILFHYTFVLLNFAIKLLLEVFLFILHHGDMCRLKWLNLGLDLQAEKTGRNEAYLL